MEDKMNNNPNDDSDINSESELKEIKLFKSIDHITPKFLRPNYRRGSVQDAFATKFQKSPNSPSNKSYEESVFRGNTPISPTRAETNKSLNSLNKMNFLREVKKELSKNNGELGKVKNKIINELTNIKDKVRLGDSIEKIKLTMKELGKVKKNMLDELTIIHEKPPDNVVVKIKSESDKKTDIKLTLFEKNKPVNHDMQRMKSAVYPDNYIQLPAVNNDNYFNNNANNNFNTSSIVSPSRSFNSDSHYSGNSNKSNNSSIYFKKHALTPRQGNYLNYNKTNNRGNFNENVNTYVPSKFKNLSIDVSDFKSFTNQSCKTLTNQAVISLYKKLEFTKKFQNQVGLNTDNLLSSRSRMSRLSKTPKVNDSIHQDFIEKNITITFENELKKKVTKALNKRKASFIYTEKNTITRRKNSFRTVNDLNLSVDLEDLTKNMKVTKK